ncbi:MAG: peptidylprolyl isomerase [Alphaproteobacteria bacterium]|nr:peptidylprolyl isomerase [Alphaproteobacteria bacterium]
MRRTGSVLLALALVLSACDDGGSSSGPSTTSGGAASQEDIGEILATVNGEPVGSTAFQQVAARTTPENGTELTLDERKEVLDRLVAEEVLYQEALRQGLDKDPKVKKVMVNTLLREKVYASVRNSDFTDAELEAYYEAHKDEFVVPEKVQIKRILIRVTDDRPDAEAKAEAERIRAEAAAAPDSFKDLAAKYSEDPYKRRGGDIGFVSAEGKPGLDQAIVDKAFEMNVDQLSEVFRTTDGYNILLVANKRERVERTFQQMKGSVLRKVKNDRLKELYESYVADLKQGINVQINEDQLGAVEVRSVRRPTLGPGGINVRPGLAPPGEEMGMDDEGDEGGEGGDVFPEGDE